MKREKEEVYIDFGAVAQTGRALNGTTVGCRLERAARDADVGSANSAKVRPRAPRRQECDKEPAHPLDPCEIDG